MQDKRKIERQPIQGGLVISKADAAERQLCTAIWLWFHAFDPVPIHGLACASWKLLWKLHEKHRTGHQTIRARIIEMVKPEFRGDFIEALSETENFIKHADRDPDAFHAFKPELTESVLMDCVLALRALNGRFPMECAAFQSWYMINHPTLITLEPENAQIFENVAKVTVGMGKADFYQICAEALIQCSTTNLNKATELRSK